MKNKKSTDQLLEEISKKLDKIIGVLAVQNIKDDNTKIKILKKLNFTSDEVGALLGIKGTSVRTRKAWKDN